MTFQKRRIATAMMVLGCASAVQADVAFNWITVGNAENPADPLNSASVPGIGSVGYEYRIAATEVNNAQYTAFLNAVDPLGGNPNGVYHPIMGSDARGGILFDFASPDGSKYSIKPNFDEKPVNYLTFFSAMRFVNWLHNGQGVGGTEAGVYSIGNGVSETRAPDARFFLPTENEWYKAAYYDPTAGAGGGDNYWLYPTRSDSGPTIATANAVGDISNPGVNVANFGQGSDWNDVNGNVTTVSSAGPTSASHYGTFDQGGNVYEWNETLTSAVHRGIRGGAWSEFMDQGLRSSHRPFTSQMSQANHIGFRVASAVLAGDVDGEGDVDLNDLAILLSTFGLCDGDTGFDADADLDGNGCVDLSDLTVLLASFGL